MAGLFLALPGGRATLPLSTGRWADAVVLLVLAGAGALAGWLRARGAAPASASVPASAAY